MFFLGHCGPSPPSRCLPLLLRIPPSCCALPTVALRERLPGLDGLVGCTLPYRRSRRCCTCPVSPARLCSADVTPFLPWRCSPFPSFCSPLLCLEHLLHLSVVSPTLATLLGPWCYIHDQALISLSSRHLTRPLLSRRLPSDIAGRLCCSQCTPALATTLGGSWDVSVASAVASQPRVLQGRRSDVAVTSGTGCARRRPRSRQRVALRRSVVYLKS